MKKRIRERVYQGFRDGSLLLNELDSDERKRLFREWENQRNDKMRNDVATEAGVESPASELHKGDLNIRLGNLLGFIYFGAQETSLDDFEDLLESGINTEMKQEGQYVKSLSLDIEFGKLMTLDDVFHQLKNGELAVEDLPFSKITDIIKADSLDLDELSERQRNEMAEALETLESLRESLSEIGE
jgi:hypothetical protein